VVILGNEENMLKNVNEYFEAGCLGKSCVYYGKDYEHIREYPAGYSRKTGDYTKEPFITVWRGHECFKDKERNNLRQDIYERAQKASDAVYNKETDITKIRFTVKRASKAFDKIADEWTKTECSFYEVKNGK
jgi:hypothetical protein